MVNDHEDECCVCMDPNTNIQTSCCKKWFHHECLSNWDKTLKRRQYTCPNCRSNCSPICAICSQPVTHSGMTMRCCCRPIHMSCHYRNYEKIQTTEGMMGKVACPRCESSDITGPINTTTEVIMGITIVGFLCLVSCLIIRNLKN